MKRIDDGLTALIRGVRRQEETMHTIKSTTLAARTRRRPSNGRLVTVVASLVVGVAAFGGGGGVDASGYRIVVPDQGYASCNSAQNTLAMTAHAAPNGDGQYLSARFQYVDQTTGRWSRVSNWTGSVYVRPTSYQTGGTTQIGYWTVGGVEGHSYQAWVQIARWTGSRWSLDSWVRSDHMTNLAATHTNAYGQAIGNLGSYNASNCVIL